jgi:hypothetical protein
MSLEKYPYRARFSAFAKAVPSVENQKYVAMAALNSLVEVFDDDIKETIIQNPDLLFWASNLALLDVANLNGDCLLKEDALRVYQKCKLKLLDIEHDRKQVVGAIHSAGFSSYPDNVMISLEEAVSSDQLIQMVVGGYVWRVVNSELCDFIESCSYETSPTYGDVSTSFELAFDGYKIGVGNGKNRYVKDALKIISSEDQDFKKYSLYLNANGGKGVDENNNIVYRILGGDILPLGAGIVSKPASGLKGVLAISPDMIKEEPEEDENGENEVENEPTTPAPQSEDVTDKEQVNLTITNTYFAEKSEKVSVEASQLEVLNIKDSTISVNNIIDNLSPMKIKSFDELAQNWGEVKKLETAASVITDLKEVAEASTREKIEEAIALKSVEFSKELDTQKSLASELEKAKNEAEASNKELSASVQALQTELQKLQAAHLAKAAEDKYNSRMEALDTEFELDDEDRQFLAEEVKSIDSDEVFAKYMGKQKKLMAAKKKGLKPALKLNTQEPGSTPSKGEDMKQGCASVNVTEVIASVEEKSGQSIPNSIAHSDNATKTLQEKVNEVMGESITIGNIKASDLKKSKK